MWGQSQRFPSVSRVPLVAGLTWRDWGQRSLQGQQSQFPPQGPRHLLENATVWNHELSPLQMSYSDTENIVLKKNSSVGVV